MFSVAFVGYGRRLCAVLVSVLRAVSKPAIALSRLILGMFFKRVLAQSVKAVQSWYLFFCSDFSRPKALKGPGVVKDATLA